MKNEWKVDWKVCDEIMDQLRNERKLRYKVNPYYQSGSLKSKEDMQVELDKQQHIYSQVLWLAGNDCLSYKQETADGHEFYMFNVYEPHFGVYKELRQRETSWIYRVYYSRLFDVVISLVSVVLGYLLSSYGR